MYSDYYNGYYPYSGNLDDNYRGRDDNFGEIITLNQAIELIKEAVGDEKEDEMFYDLLIEQAPTEKEKNIIKSIRDEEMRHNQILRKLYSDFTGQMLPSDNSVSQMNNTQNYKGNLEKALFGELEAVKRYRKILAQMPSGNSYTLLMSIMTDELRHASKYNFLIHNAG